MLYRVLALFLALPALAQAQSPDLNTLLHDIWEYNLKTSPVFASAIGDPRYNNQLPNLSPSATNDRIRDQNGFLLRLLAIDTSALAPQQRLAAENLQREFLHDEEAARFKQWELPIDRSHSIQADLPAMAGLLPFAAIKDYDDYIARLHLVPRQLRQASENLLAGIDDHRVQPMSILEPALKKTEELAAQTPAESPFASPLKRFPAAIDAPNRKRISADMLEAIQTDVLPAYARFAKFLRVTELPAAGNESLPDHTLSYQLDEWKIMELRDSAIAALGPRFNLKAFHDIVANGYALPPDVLDQQLKAWITATR